MKFELVRGRYTVQRSAEEKAPLLARLSRIEGQVRGLQRLVEENRFYGEILQQSSAITAAVREVTLMIISEQVVAHLDAMGRTRDMEPGAGRVEGLEELIEVLRSAGKF